MIVAFYNEKFERLLNNASLRVNNKGYKLVKRPIELNDLNCTCEAFTEDIQPTFLVISDARGRYVYGSLAGVPNLNEKNQTEIYGTDLKSMLSSDIVLNTSTMEVTDADTVRHSVQFLFNLWNTQNQNSFTCELQFVGSFDPETNFDPDEITDYSLVDYKGGVYDAFEEIQKFMRFYDLYMDTKIDVVNKKIVFMVGRTMASQVNLKLWEYGIKNYGKIVADINEAQGYYGQDETDPSSWQEGTRWILTSNNEITSDTTKRDIYPVKRKVVTSTESLLEANKSAIEALLGLKYNEDIDLQATVIGSELKRFAIANLSVFSARFDVYTERGGELYKSLPCGELEYNANNELVRFKTGYRYTSVNFI